MSTSFGSFTFSRLAGALAGLWLCGAGAAWAGDGGDLATLQAVIGPPNGTSGLCKILKLTTCYQLPTITQAVLEVAGLTNSPPEMVAAQNSIAPGYNVIAGNPATAPYAPNFLPISFPLPAESTTSTTVSELLSTLTPIAFDSQKSGTALPTQLFDPNADTFLYAVGESSQGTPPGVGNLTNPDTVYFFYDDLFRVAQNFTKGQIVAKFSFPPTVLNSDGSENPAIMITLKILATCNGGPACLQAYVSGGGIAPSTPASNLGIQFALVFSASPTSTKKHAIFEVAVPLLVTGACAGDPSLCVGGQLTMPPSIPTANTDPPYFYSAITGQPGNVSTAPNLTGNFSVYTAFGAGLMPDVLGAILPSGTLPKPAYSIGLAPTAGSPSSFTFALCASLPDNSDGPAARLRPAVGAYYAIATDGETYLGAPLAPAVASVCPAL